jgi:hypothetical protein
MPDMSIAVKAAQRILLLGGIFFGGCSTAKDVAVTSFRVLDAPANYVRRKIDNPNTTTTTTTTTVASDVATPGRHVVPTSRGPQQRPVTAPPQRGPAAAPRVTRNPTVDSPKPSPSAAPRSVTNPPAQYPTAKVVPGKPGYVFSPYDPSGGYVDVNGYASGSKVKDPYSGKVFLVP